MKGTLLRRSERRHTVLVLELKDGLTGRPRHNGVRVEILLYSTVATGLSC